ncbi:hypothetical protein KRR38_22185 [Novosphingobium sp. G106]|uniref:hypothetical protein n=1 Tax=Novosphingobium sp. G106 TaxID=2849500 RepID=UPI001C2DE31D|nr:hypothetical protein [Novosphingobium sp. G106]MBV1690317.1 hypothetical protein [Novosphingobium sp. G106]
MVGEEAPYLFRELEPARWRDHLCAERTTLLDALLAAEANGVVRLGYTNIRAPGTVAILERAPSDNALEHVQVVGKTMPGINIVGGGIGCGNHYCEIDWSVPVTGRPGFLRRLAYWCARRFS